MDPAPIATPCIKVCVIDGESGLCLGCQRTLAEVAAAGNLVPAAHLVALMRAHGVSNIWTSDRDFRKFDGIRVKSPFASSGR